MVLPLVGLGLMAGGTALNLAGSYQRDKATKKAIKNYRNAMNAHFDQERTDLQDEAGVLSGLATERQTGVGDYLSGLAMAQHPATDQAYVAGQSGVLSDIAKQTGSDASTYAYSGAPRTGAEGIQTSKTSQDNARAAAAMLAEHENRQIAENEAMAQHRMALSDLLRGAKTGSIQRRLQLARALRDLDWKRKTTALQSQLDDAQNKGQWANVLGGLGTQAGGMLLTAGLAGGAEAGGAGLASDAANADFFNANTGP